jgi:hypothetical protein
MFPDEDASGIVLAFPGPWPDRSALTAAIVRSGNGIAAGALITETGTGLFAGFSVEPPVEDLAHMMQAGSGEDFGAESLRVIAGHQLLPHLIIDPSDDDFLTRLKVFTRILRDAGAAGVCVSRSGVSHGLDRWQSLLDAGDPAALYNALMVHVAVSDDELTSFGMKQFALPDASAPIDVEGEHRDAATLRSFNLYQWVERPELIDGQTFSMSEEAPVFRLTHAPDTRYEPGHHHLNPHGVWQLSWAE